MTGIRSGPMRAAAPFAALIMMAMLAATAPASAYTPEQEQACSSDAFRLCSSEIPDVDRVTACMARNRTQLSPPCRAQFGPEPRETVEDEPVGRPRVIRPATTRKPAKARAHKTTRSAKS
jgi:hypothetical protein